MTSGGSLTFILSPGVVASGQVWMERVEADRAAPTPSSLFTDKAGVLVQEEGGRSAVKADD